MIFMNKNFLVFWLGLCLSFTIAKAQDAYQHVSDKVLYSFLDELATMHIIDISTATKPYPRKTIADLLLQAKQQQEKLTLSQKARVENYLKEYALEAGSINQGRWQLYQKDSTLSVHLLPPEIAYRDTLFRALVRPVYGYRNFSGGNNDFWVTYGGAEAISYIGDNWGVYVSLRDNYQKGQKLAQPTYFTQEPGGTYKALTGGGEGGEFSEMRGGLTYNWGWGTFAFVKDHIQWGDNQNGSNIFSGRTPSFPLIKLHMNPAKWIEFNYFHGWLVSEAIDSLNSFFPEEGIPRTVQRRKYIAANMYTIKPFPRFRLSLGNSIVYGDTDVQPAFLIPFFFYKSIVHTINWGTTFQNSAMYINLSSRQIKNLHLYASYFIDEFSIRRVGDSTRHNFTGFKGGFSLAGWPIKNVTLGGEYTRTNPITYLHDEEVTSFQSNRYNLGHYLTDNAEEFFAVLRIHPYKTWQISASWMYARKGNYYEYERRRRNPRIDEMPVLDDIIWDKTSFTLETHLYLLSNLRAFAKYSFNNVQGYDADEQTAQYYLNTFSPPYLHGRTQVMELGFNLGF